MTSSRRHADCAPAPKTPRRAKASPERGGGTAERRDGEVFVVSNLRRALQNAAFSPLSRLRRQLPFQGSQSEGACRNGRGADAAAQSGGRMISAPTGACPAALSGRMRHAPKASPERGGGTPVRRDGEVFVVSNLRRALQNAAFSPLSRLRRQLPCQGSQSEGAFRNRRGGDAPYRRFAEKSRNSGCVSGYGVVK